MRRRELLTATAALGAAAGTGCLHGDTSSPSGGLDYVDGLPEHLLAAVEGSDRVGDLYTAEELVELRYQGDGYEVSGSYRPDDGAVAGFRAAGGDRYVVVDRGAPRLKKLDGLREVESTVVRDLESFDVQGGYVYVCVGHELLVFDGDLKEVGRTEVLPSTEKDKHLESTIAYGESVYVLDNIVRPLYLFRVDVSDPTEPRRAEVLQTWGVNESLGPQWLLPEDGLWLYQGRSTTRGGSRHVVYHTSIDEAETEEAELPLFDGEEVDVRSGGSGGAETVYSSPLYPERADDEESGFRLQDVADRGGAAVVDYVDDDRWLVEFTADDGGGVDVERRHRVPDAVSVAEHEGDVYLLQERDGSADVTVYDDAFMLQHEQSLPSEKLSSVQDLRPG